MIVKDNHRLTVEALSDLLPKGGWVVYGDKFEDIEWIDCEPVSKEDFIAAQEIVKTKWAEEEATAKIKRETTVAKLEALGLDEDDLKALGL
jgi:hypothetical protein